MIHTQALILQTLKHTCTLNHISSPLAARKVMLGMQYAVLHSVSERRINLLSLKVYKGAYLLVLVPDQSVLMSAGTRDLHWCAHWKHKDCIRKAYAFINEYKQACPWLPSSQADTRSRHNLALDHYCLKFHSIIIGWLFIRQLLTFY